MKITFSTLSASSLLAVSCAAMLAAPAATAHPSTYPYLPTPVAVSVDGLDVGTAAGARTLMRRIQAAAARACGPQPSDIRQLGYAQLHGYCQERNMEALVRAADAPRVTALYQQRAQPRSPMER